MDYGLADHQKDIAELAYRLGQQKLKPAREHHDATGEFPWPLVEEMRKSDLFGVYLPESYGGLGGLTLELVLVVEQLSRACGGIAQAVSATGHGALPILLFGDADQRKRWLPELASGAKLGAFALAEPEGAGRCTARLDGDHYVIDGRKSFCVNGEAAGLYTFFAATEGARGLSAFVVEKGTPGFSFGERQPKMASRAAWTCELVFKDCRLPKRSLLHKPGHGLLVAQASQDASRLAAAAHALGIAQGALDETVAYARVRKQFGQTIASFQAIQHMLADAATAVEAARALLYATAAAADKALKPAVDAAVEKGTVVHDEFLRLGSRAWTKEAAMCKVLCSDTAMKVASDCVQMCGGIGFMRDFPVEKYMRDAKVAQIYDGANQLQRNEIAMSMLAEAASKQKEAVAA